MSLDFLITGAIGVAAASYVFVLARRSARRLLAPRPAGESACGGCSGCGTAEGHSEDEDSCTVRKEKLVVLGRQTPNT